MVTRRDVGPLPILSHLTGRDHTILGWLYDHRVMTTDQIATALFPSLDTAQDRLRSLYVAGLLDRGRMHREGGGKYSWRYMLDRPGWEIVAAVRGDRPPPRRDKVRARNTNLVLSPKTTHLLGVNGFFTSLVGQARTHPGTELAQWRSEWQAAQMVPVVMAIGTRIRPDGWAVWTEQDEPTAFFFEYDTGTEPLATLVEKVANYAEFYRTGPRWPVLFWLPSRTRETNFHDRVDDIAALVATAVAERGTTPADALWWLYGSTGSRMRLSSIPGDGPDLPGWAP
jgi:hypothetical protein